MYIFSHIQDYRHCIVKLNGQSLGSLRFFYVFERSLLCLLSLHLFDQKYNKNSNIVK